MFTRFTTALCPAALLLASTAWAEPADFHTDGTDTLRHEQVAAPALAETGASAIDLEAIAASDPNLTLRPGAGAEPDAMVMLSDVLFEFGKAELGPDGLATLKSVAKKLDGVAGLKITGHTDSVGTDERNKALGLARADSVRTWLIDTGYLRASAVTIDSAGESEPIAANLTPDGADDAAGRALNRRVEFSIVEEQPEEVADAAQPHPTVF